MRRSRVLLAQRRLWRRRMVFWAGALAIGVVSVAFAFMADHAQTIFFGTISRPGQWWPLLPLLMTPAGFVLCAWLANAFFAGSQGSGIP